MATRSSGLDGLMHNYSQLKAVPAVLGIVFAVASLYQFGGISTVEVAWFDYTLTGTHAMFTSIGVLVIAFMSSETDDFEYYEEWEQALIAAGPILIVGYHYIGFVETIVNTADPWGQVFAFLVCVAGYTVAMR